jgi:ABC-2 type transport system permease protein
MNVDIVRSEAGLATRDDAEEAPRRLGPLAYLACFRGIVWREVLRFLHQRERFFSALVRPLVWLFIFAAGFRQVLGVSIIPPYETYVLYEVYVVPGLLGMILLFNAMQSSLSMVYDRETGAMRTLLVSPFPRSFLLLSKLVGGVAVAAIQAYVFLGIFYFWEAELSREAYLILLAAPALLLAALAINAWVDKLSESTIGNLILLTAVVEAFVLVGVIYYWQLLAPSMNYLAALPALILAGLMLGSISLFLSSVIRQLENFAGVMNFVIFPMFFASSALYPLWRIREASPFLFEVCRVNPFTYAVELIRFALYGQVGARLEDGTIDLTNLYVVLAYTVFFLGAAIYAYNPSKGLIARRGGPGGGG